MGGKSDLLLLSFVISKNYRIRYFSVQSFAILAVNLDEDNNTLLIVSLLYIRVCVGKHIWMLLCCQHSFLLFCAVINTHRYNILSLLCTVFIKLFSGLEYRYDKAT